MIFPLLHFGMSWGYQDVLRIHERGVGAFCKGKVVLGVPCNRTIDLGCIAYGGITK